MRFSTRLGALPVAALFSGAALLSCGGGSVETTSDAGRATKTMRPGVDLLAHDGSFEPLVVKLESGDRAELVIVNDGFAPHTFTIRGLGLDELIAPDSLGRVALVMPDREVRFVCRFHPVMRGRLVPTS